MEILSNGSAKKAVETKTQQVDRHHTANGTAVEPIARQVRYFDKSTFDFVGQKALVPVNEKYLRKVFGFDNDDPMLFSYPVTEKQKRMIERLASIKINFDKYEYFIECDFGKTGKRRIAV